MKKSDLEVISFSGGRSSAMMLKIMLDNDMMINDRKIVFANTGREKPETLDFVQECAERWGLEIVWLEYMPEKPLFKIVDYETANRDGLPFSQLITKRSILPNVVKRLCTAELKIKTIRRYMRSIGHKGDLVTYLGLRYDEPMRVAKKKAQNQTSKDPEYYLMPLHDMKVSKAMVDSFWKHQSFDLAIHSNLGNCDLCFMKGTNNLIWAIRNDPSLADWWIEQEKHAKMSAKRKRKGQFNKEWSYKTLLDIALNQTYLKFLDEEPPPSFSMDCSCTD